MNLLTVTETGEGERAPLYQCDKAAYMNKIVSMYPNIIKDCETLWRGVTSASLCKGDVVPDHSKLKLAKPKGVMASVGGSAQGGKGRRSCLNIYKVPIRVHLLSWRVRRSSRLIATVSSSGTS